MDKQEVIAEIQRIAHERGGVPPGQKRFCAETGIREHEVIGPLWSRWSDALVEAGFPANAWNGPKDENLLLSQFVDLARRLGKLPTGREIQVEGQTNPGFPSRNAFLRRFGTKAQVASRVRTWCEANPGNEDVLAMCAEPQLPNAEEPRHRSAPDVQAGYVYLIKSGRHYKIGRSNDVGRRRYEIRLQQPEAAKIVWTIKTDDPEGIESYWHQRFAERRKGGEWFDLRKPEVDAFRRWRRIY